MPTDDTEVTITDRDCAPITNPVRDWSEVDAEVRFNEVVAGSFTATARPELVDALAPGNRVVIRDQGAVFKSGPIEAWDFARTATGDKAAPGQITVDFADDAAHIANRITYPNPGAPVTAQTANAQWTGTGPAGTLILALVDANAGPAALPARRVSKLTIGAGADLGATVTYASRYEDLFDAIRALALLGGAGLPGSRLGFRTRQDGRDIIAEVYAPRDRTHLARFSFGLNNLREVQATTQAPTCTAAIVAGPGEGTARNMVERVDSAGAAAWWRAEEFVDQRQANTAQELEQAGDEALDTGREQATVITDTIDTPQIVYGDAYQVGDLALVMPGAGLALTDVVRAVRLQVTPRTGRTRTALIGTQAAITDPAWVAGNRTLARRIAGIERI